MGYYLHGILKNNNLIRYDASSEPYVYIGAQIISQNAFNGIEKEVFSEDIEN